MQRTLEGVATVNAVAFRFAAWCLLAMVLTSTGLVLARYGLGVSSIAVQEAVMYLHALLIALGLAGTWQVDGHVRIDILYGRWTANAQAWVNRIGVILLALPFALFVLWSCFDYVSVAWQRAEASSEPGGLAYLWLLKTVLVVFPMQLILAAIWWLKKGCVESAKASTEVCG